MSGESEDNPQEELNQGIDLSELQNLQFGPDWTETTSRTGGNRRDDDRGGNRRRDDSGPARRDRRPQGRGGPPRGGGGGDDNRSSAPRRDGPRGMGSGAREQRPERSGGDRRQGRGDSRRHHQQYRPFEPTVQVMFYPEDVPFRALTKAIRNSMRTYELFEIARLILDKPERFVVVIKPLSARNKGGADDGENAPRDSDEKGAFLISAPDGIPFENEEDALNHILKHHIERFFRVEEVEVDPPKGSFPFVNRCTITGALLGPPNYHRYQAILQEHHASRLPNMSLERVSSKLEQVRDEEVIQQWIQQMTKATRYIPVDAGEDDPPFLENLESARHFLLTRRRSKTLRRVDAPRLSGKDIDKMPEGNLKASVESVLEQQRRFPLDTANNLRGRLRRMRFNIYKKGGGKGVSMVCAIKRRTRDENTRFSASIEHLIHFIEEHPNIPIGELPKEFLGLDLEQMRQPAEPPANPAPETEPAAPANTTAEVVGPAAPSETGTGETPAADAETVPANRAQASGVAPTNVEASAHDSQADLSKAANTTDEASAEATPHETSGGADQTDSGKAAEPSQAQQPATAQGAEKQTPPPDAEPETAKLQEQPNEFPGATEEERKALRQLTIDLRWLIGEGYVVEYGDGTLYAPPKVQAQRGSQSRRAESPREGTEDAGSAASGDAPTDDRNTPATPASGTTEARDTPPDDLPENAAPPAPPASSPFPLDSLAEPAKPSDSPDRRAHDQDAAPEEESARPAEPAPPPSAEEPPRNHPPADEQTASGTPPASAGEPSGAPGERG